MSGYINIFDENKCKITTSLKVNKCVLIMHY